MTIPKYVQELMQRSQYEKWVERQAGGEMIILEFPKETHYRRQYAVVTIFDPVMKYLESYIPSEEERKAKRKHVYS